MIKLVSIAVIWDFEGKRKGINIPAGWLILPIYLLQAGFLLG
jgi:hypothetical protein